MLNGLVSIWLRIAQIKLENSGCTSLRKNFLIDSLLTYKTYPWHVLYVKI